MKKFSVILILIIANIIFFNKQLIKIYCSYKFSNWTEKKIVFDEFKVEYPNSIFINGLKIINSNTIYYDSIFEAEKIDINFNLKSLLFNELIIINYLNIEKPKFFLEVIEKNIKLEESAKNIEITYEDNIGLAKKINENTPDKVWPQKKKDINFLILRSNISGGRAFIKISSMPTSSETLMSDFKFIKIGNHKEHQHYKNVLKIMLFDIFASVKDSNQKKILKKIYNL